MGIVSSLFCTSYTHHFRPIGNPANKLRGGQGAHTAEVAADSLFIGEDEKTFASLRAFSRLQIPDEEFADFVDGWYWESNGQPWHIQNDVIVVGNGSRTIPLNYLRRIAGVNIKK